MEDLTFSIQSERSVKSDSLDSLPMDASVQKPSLKSKNGKPEAKKRRKRNTVVCLSCKKRKIKCDRKKPCGQCEESNASNFCFYSSPQWALDTFMESKNGGTNSSTEASNSQTNHSEGNERLSMTRVDFLNKTFANTFNTVEMIESPTQKVDFLLEHIKQVQATINKLQGTKNEESMLEYGLNMGKDDEHEKKHPDYDILLNFHEAYSSLEIKRSSDISSQPLTTAALINKDPYLSLIFKYYNARTINRKLLKNCFPGEKLTRGHESNIAHSVLDMIKINEDKIPPPKSILDKKQKNETILNLQGIISVCAEHNEEVIKKEILELLLDIPAIYLKKYVINFWNFVYPTIPIFDKDEFEGTLRRIFGIDIMAVSNEDKETRITELHLVQTFDLIHVAIFLIMIRFSYLCIITQLKLHITDRNLLKHFKVPNSFFTAANKCLSTYKPFRKSKIILLQFLALVKSYSLFSVEDGEGNDLHQGVVLKNIVAILLKMMGMNRDPRNNLEVFTHCFGASSERKSYVWRKIFWTLVTLDHKTSILSGLMSNFSEPFLKKFCDTKFPQPLPYFVNFELEKGICDFLRITNNVSSKFTNIVDFTSRVNEFVSLREIISEFELLKDQLDKNQCTLAHLKRLNITNYTKDIEELDYELFTSDILTTSLSNFTIIELNILSLNMEMSVYHSICVALENKKIHSSQETLNEVMVRLMQVIKEITDICHMYLNNEFRDYIVKLDYHLNRLVQLTVEKCCLIIASMALRIAFTKPSVSEEELKIKKKTFENCLLVMNEMGSLLFNSCGIKYYQGYKSLITLRFVFKLLNYYPFESTPMAMIQFFYNFYNSLQIKLSEADSTMKEKITKLFKNNSFQRGILLEANLTDFMNNWTSLTVNDKVVVESSRYNNCLDSKQLVSKINEIFPTYKSIKEQLFEFQIKNKGNMTAVNRQNENLDSETQNNVPATTENQVGAYKATENGESVVTPGIQNFTIITEHTARNILNDSPASMIEEKNSNSYLFSMKNLNQNKQQIPSLLGDEKIVKYLIPGLNYEEPIETRTIPDDSSASGSLPSEAGKYNDAIMNYGIDILLGENELFPDDETFFNLFK